MDGDKIEELLNDPSTKLMKAASDNSIYIIIKQQEGGVFLSVTSSYLCRWNHYKALIRVMMVVFF